MDLVDGRRKFRALKLELNQLKALMHPIRLKILSELSTPQYSANLAKKFGMSEQRLYYHMRLLEKAGLIKVVKKESKRGALARIYQSTSQAFGIVLPGAETEARGPEFLDWFMESLIVVGSPDPHGPYKARARDNYYAAELALYLGRFKPKISVKTDTELRPEDRKNNLILVGGPIVNVLADEVNSKLKVKFSTSNGTVIESSITGKKYYDEECGLIALTENPWDKTKKVLILAGKGYKGTKAAIVGLSKYPNELKESPRVVLGVDVDGDGVVDDVEFLE